MVARCLRALNGHPPFRSAKRIDLGDVLASTTVSRKNGLAHFYFGCIRPCFYLPVIKERKSNTFFMPLDSS